MESQSRVRPRRWIIPAFIAAAAGVAYAAERVCKAPLAEIRSGKASVKSIIATVKEGDKLEVLEEDKRGWLKVRVAGKEGYVYESALNAPAKRGLLASSDPRASATELAAAGKGLTDTAIQYASSKNLSTAGVEKMLENRRRLTEQDFNAFVAEGNLKAMAMDGAPDHATSSVAIATAASTEGGSHE